jgi:hypothetical protein
MRCVMISVSQVQVRYRLTYIDNRTGLLVRRPKLRDSRIVDNQKHVSEGVVLVPDDMHLLMESYIGKSSTTRVAILPVEEGVETIRSLRPPCSIFIHELAVPRNAMPFIAKCKVAHVSEMRYRACGPRGIICRTS